MKPAEKRLLLGADALLSIEAAAELLPVRDSDARALIERSGIVRRLAGRRVCRWRDCLALAELEQEPTRGGQVRQLRRKR